MNAPTLEQQRYLIRVDDLKTYFRTMDGTVRAVDGVTLDIRPGRSAGPGRRIGLRQERDRLFDLAPAAAKNQPHRAGQHPVRPRRRQPVR